ncbi:MAG: LysM peptidoglycan-binding domain-containing protein [Eubacterium sp.]|nr:LysM peptidoglycan-binding domain-containing protein [Eubacterium sp.]
MAEQKQRSSGTLPKNIRQIGTSTGSTRVYLEDYVYTYLHTQEVQETWTNRGFMLLGRLEKGKDYARYFISGLIRVEDEYFKDHILQFNDDTWTFIYKEMKTYYDNLEIVGWGQDVSSANAAISAELERSHKQNFNIQKNVLFLLDLVENEEAFYIFEKNILQRREGYYVYYEKNPQMQEYMIDKNKNRELDISPEEIKEPLVQSYRETLLEKKAQLSERKWNGVLYTTSLLLVLSVCVLGVSTVNNVEKMQDLESAMNQISGKGGQAGIQSSDVPAMSANVQDGDETDLNEAGSADAGHGNQNGDEKDSDKDSDQDSDQESDSKKETSSGSAKTAGDTDDNEKETGFGGDEKSFETNSDDSGKSKSSGNKHKQDTSSEDDGEKEPISSDSLETSALTEAQTSLLQGYYIVKEGDSLVGISKKIYGTAAKARKICTLNGIEDMDMIYAGQRLELP